MRFAGSASARATASASSCPSAPRRRVAHVAAAKLGAIAVPLSILFGPDALEMRLRDADVRVVLGEGEPLERIAELGLDVPLIDVDRDLERLLAGASPRFEPVATTPDTPALLVYTSGTTGPPKGALHGHRVLPGHLPGFELSHDHFPHDGDVIWTPADWAWIGGLYDVLMPALRHGRPVVAYRGGKFDPERAFDLIGRLGVRNVFMPATALRLMRSHDPGTPVSLRTVASGGETVGVETADWCRERLGVRLNEFYGQTEANLLVGNCCAWEARPGSMGLPYPGHDVRVVDGEVCVRVDGDPVAFLGYWRNEEATAAKVRDGWLHTGDQAEQDEDGYVYFVGRDDDVISSAGHRIGPGPIEECLIRHPAVSLAAVIGSPDEQRGEVVKAYVVAAPGVTVTDELSHELQAFVRERLSAYEYPRAVAFVDELPTTVTGKIRRGELRRLDRREPDSTLPLALAVDRATVRHGGRRRGEAGRRSRCRRPCPRRVSWRRRDRASAGAARAAVFGVRRWWDAAPVAPLDRGCRAGARPRCDRVRVLRSTRGRPVADLVLVIWVLILRRGLRVGRGDLGRARWRVGASPGRGRPEPTHDAARRRSERRRHALAGDPDADDAVRSRRVVTSPCRRSARVEQDEVGAQGATRPRSEPEQVGRAGGEPRHRLLDGQQPLAQARTARGTARPSPRAAGAAAAPKMPSEPTSWSRWRAISRTASSPA